MSWQRHWRENCYTQEHRHYFFLCKQSMTSCWGPEFSLVPGKWQMLKTATSSKAVCHMLWSTEISKLLCSEISRGSLHFPDVISKLLYHHFPGTFSNFISLCSLPHTPHFSHMVLFKLPWCYPEVLYLHVLAHEDFYVGCLATHSKSSPQWCSAWASLQILSQGQEHDCAQNILPRIQQVLPKCLPIE